MEKADLKGGGASILRGGVGRGIRGSQKTSSHPPRPHSHACLSRGSLAESYQTPGGKGACDVGGRPGQQAGGGGEDRSGGETEDPPPTDEDPELARPAGAARAALLAAFPEPGAEPGPEQALGESRRVNGG